MELFGKTLIWLATAGVIASLVMYLRGEQWVKQARWTFRGVTLLISLSLGLLVTLILMHRFDFVYVRNYSSSDLPLYYLIATLWGGQEGTLLLWVFYVSILAVVLTRTIGRFERFSMVIINLFIFSILLILLERSPFAATPDAPPEGAGLNPLLQDFWMTIHPPIMFVGFALSVFPFAIAIAGWLRQEYKAWTSYAWPWLLATWCVLATALVMGGYWAYKVLGWGGYWAWDPVENSSLIPWIFATGGIHSLMMFRKKNSLARSAYMFSILPFIAILFGSFLTRSGVLGDFSVHSFLDLGINSYLIASLAAFGTLGFGLLFWRFNRVKATIAYGSMGTVDFLVSVGVLSLLVAGALVLVGMSTPLWTRLGGPPSNVTLRYYFLATTPIALILLFALSVFPFMKWIKPSKPFISHDAAIPFTISMLVGAVAILSGVHEVLYIVLLVLGSFAVASNSWLVFDGLRRNRRLPGAYIAHVGLAMLIIGAAVSSAYETREQVPLPMGETVERMGWKLTYEGKDHEHSETPFHVLVEREGSSTAYRMSPRQFELPYGKGMMRKPAVKKFWNKDLYLSPVDEVGGQPGQTLTFTKGETQSLGGIEVTFLGFEMGGHGEGEMGKVGCAFQLTGNMVIDTVTPVVQSTSEGMSDVPATSADGRFTFAVGRINANTGAVELDVVDRDNPTAAKPVFWVEISEKPLINLFWAGTTLMVFGGLLALRKRAGQMDDDPDPDERSASSETVPEVASVASPRRPKGVGTT